MAMIMLFRVVDIFEYLMLLLIKVQHLILWGLLLLAWILWKEGMYVFDAGSCRFMTYGVCGWIRSYVMLLILYLPLLVFHEMMCGVWLVLRVWETLVSFSCGLSVMAWLGFGGEVTVVMGDWLQILGLYLGCLSGVYIGPIISVSYVLRKEGLYLVLVGSLFS